jgi:hypothetical protein
MGHLAVHTLITGEFLYTWKVFTPDKGPTTRENNPSGKKIPYGFKM